MKKRVKELVCSDCFRYYAQSDLMTRIKARMVHSAFNYSREYRKVHSYMERNKKGLGYLFHRYKYLRLSKKTGYQINAEATIGSGLYMGHRGTVIINGDVIMGSNINIMPGVTIGQENRGERKGAPLFENNIWIGSNSVIVGKIHIGSNVLIAPNVYLNFDVPNDSIVVGNPSKIISNKEATKEYIQNPYEK